jgi:hypothetical protein|tara:strand:- start:61 stop:213 length:153 start_codon:yes stop_codon:yes gene_type:complete
VPVERVVVPLALRLEQETLEQPILVEVAAQSHTQAHSLRKLVVLAVLGLS